MHSPGSVKVEKRICVIAVLGTPFGMTNVAVRKTSGGPLTASAHRHIRDVIA